MKVYLSDVKLDNLFSNGFSNEILTCTISEKTDEGYIINIMGKEIFAKSDLTLNPNELISVKIDRSLPTQLTLKVLPDIKTPLKSDILTYTTNLNKQLSMTMLSKLNMSMTDDRLKLLSEIFNSLSKNPQKPDLEKTKSELYIIKKLLKTSDSLDKYISNNKAPNELPKLNQSSHRSEIPKPTENDIIKNALQKIKQNIKKEPSSKSVKQLLELIDSFDDDISDFDIPLEIPILKEFFYKGKTESKDFDKLINKLIKNVFKKLQENIKENPSSKSIKKLLTLADSFKKNTNESVEPIYSKQLISKAPEDFEEFKKCISQKLKENIEKEPQLFKKAVAIKTLNIAYSNEKIDTRFIFLPLLTDKPAYIKLSKNKKESHRKSQNKDDDNPIEVSVLLDTRNLGKVLADFTYKKNGISSSLTFEKKDSLEYVKRVSHSSNDYLLKSIHFSLKKISTKKFFFQGLETKKIPRKVNIKI